MDALQRKVNKVDKKATISNYEPNKYRVLLKRLITARPMIKSIEDKGRFKVTKIIIPDVKIDETVCILYVDRLCFKTITKRKANAKILKESIIKKSKRK